jgi:hypothetical protein
MFWQGKSLEKMRKSKIYARIPLPALRATFPPGEGIAHRNNREINRIFSLSLSQHGGKYKFPFTHFKICGMIGKIEKRR